MSVVYLGCRIKCDGCGYSPDGACPDPEDLYDFFQRNGWLVGMYQKWNPFKLLDYCRSCAVLPHILDDVKAGRLKTTPPAKKRDKP